MRVLHILDHGLPLQSGYVYRSLGILAAQRARGWDTVQLTTPRQRAWTTPTETLDGWTYHRTPIPGALWQAPVAREVAEIIATTRRLGQVIRETKPDILHAHSPVLTAIPALLAGRRYGLPVVYEIRGFWEDAAADLGTSKPGGLRYKATRWLESQVIRRVDAVATLCDGMRREIAARGIANENLIVVPNAVDADRFTFSLPRDQELCQQLGVQDKVVLGFIGSFYHYEGLDLLMEAAPDLLARVPDLRILLVGGGPEEAKLRKMAAERQLDGRVIFAGRVKNDVVERYYSLVDIFACPRHSIRLTELVTPLKPLEAMAMGKVVMASNVGGHKELVRDGDTGFLFQADDAQALVELGARLANAPDLRQNAAVAGRKFVENERRWSHSVANYVPIYQRLAGAAAAA